jgi:uncharacterized protein (TIGR02996 family)
MASRKGRDAGGSPRSVRAEQFTWRPADGHTPPADEEAFLRGILAHPDDAMLWSIYADWLEERGDPRAEFLRVQAELMTLPPQDAHRTGLKRKARELRAGLDPGWLTLLGKEKIENCDFGFRFQCPLQWDRLQLTVNAAVRYCDVCGSNVYFCGTINQARHHALVGNCVAINSSVLRTPGDLPTQGARVTLGIPLRIRDDPLDLDGGIGRRG